ncbi:MAG: hypothetical protein JOY64_04065, partial [Alphaproteobacteria bacterium]|nr:hypothetical protein [Alphaproteobacteria bacterium]
MGGLLSTKFAPNSNVAIVKADGHDGTTFKAQEKVSAGGLPGLFGAKVHAKSTLAQQKEVFSELKRELREKYLGTGDFTQHDAAADKLNSDIRAAEKKKSFFSKPQSYRGSDSVSVGTDVAKLATIKRLETEIDQLASGKNAHLTPTMLAALKSKAEVQFASIGMDAIKGYRSQSEGGGVSASQNFNPLKDYKSLLRSDNASAKVVRLTGEGEASRIELAGSKTASVEGTAEKTLAHCVASLKQAYFRAGPDAPTISSKEVAFDRQVAKYVERGMLDNATGKLRELTKGDFQKLEKLAYDGRSTVGRVERPFNDIIGKTAGTANSRYSDLTLDKDHGAIHLVNDGNPHSVMFIETFDPEANKWNLAKLDFGYSLSERSERSLMDKFSGDKLLPGKVMLSEGSVTLAQAGEQQKSHQPSQTTNPGVISEADLKIGRNVPSKLLGFINLGARMDDITSIRIPISELNKMLETAKLQHDQSNDGLQGNTALYHLKGQSLSGADLTRHPAGYEEQQAEDTLELARSEALLAEIGNAPDATPSELLRSLRNSKLLTILPADVATLDKRGEALADKRSRGGKEWDAIETNVKVRSKAAEKR